MSSKKTRQAYRSTFKAVIASLQTDADSGLSSAEAAARLEQYGPNTLKASKRIHPLRLFLNQFKDVLVIILLVAALVSWGVSLIHTDSSQSASHDQQILAALACDRLTADFRDTDRFCGQPSTICGTEYDGPVSEYCEGAEESEGAQEALLIFAIVIAIAVIGFFNEYRAEKTVEALKKLVGQKATIKRAGKVVEVDASDIVPGDIIILEEGMKVPADIRLGKVSSLYINEASLTGESLPVGKNTLTLKQTKPLGDQKSMAFAGTHVTQGTAEGVVVATAQETELGKIASLVNEVEEAQTPMQRKLDELGRKLGFFVLLTCVVVFIIVLLFVDEAQDGSFLVRAIFAFTAAVALAVAAIPEGLAFVVRISLALGARRMALKNALVRKLSAVEALGSTDVICSDKTGTLTRGEMTVRSVYAADQVYSVSGTGYSLAGNVMQGAKKLLTKRLPKAVELTLRTGTLCNNAHIKNDGIIGDPTEGALLVAAAKAGLDHDQLNSSFDRIHEVPFTSERKRMSVACRGKDGFSAYSKGATESVLELCTHIQTRNGRKKITDKDKQAIMDMNSKLASKALRVLAFAQKDMAARPKTNSEIERGLTFVGLQAMMDPPRTEVKEVVHRVQAESGIRVVMITGDYIETAKAVAAEIGLEGEALSGVDIDAMSHEEFEDRVEHTSVYARVNPEHKIRIVKALKAHGHQVAMTGDGVNDAPAIKAADIGIAMGITGTDASKEAADLILLDDQFLTIIGAIEEGRGIFDNVRKFVNFLISCNIAEVLAVLVGILVFNDLILTAAQLLFINIVTDGLPAVALGSDPAQSDSLQQKPQHYQESILNKRTWVEITTFGVLMTIAVIGHYWYNINNYSAAAAASGAFTALVVYQLVRLVDIRTDYAIRWFSNPWLSVAMLSSIALQFVVLYFSPVAEYFGVVPLRLHDWVIIAVGSAVLFVAMKALNPLFDYLGPEAKVARQAK